MCRAVTFRAIGVLIAASSTAASAEDRGPFSFSISPGIVFGEANEIVYGTTGSRDSQLIWKLGVPTVTLGAEYKWDDRLTVTGSLTVGKGGSSEMTDYDWFGPNFVSGNFGDWTHRSYSDNTRVGHYYKLDVGARYDLMHKSGVQFSALAGVSYTSVKWTATGGSYVYSDSAPGDGCGFRGCTGDFANAPVIAYLQRLPAAYVGLSASHEMDRVTLSGNIKLGASFDLKDRDNHFLRNLLFDESFDVTPYVGLGLKAEVKTSERGAFSLTLDFDKFFKTKGDAWTTDTSSGAMDSSQDAAGLDLTTARVGVGYTVAF